MKAEHFSIWKVSQEDFHTEEEGNSEMVFWKYPTNFLVRVNSREEIGDHTRQKIILNDWIKNKIEFEWKWNIFNDVKIVYSRGISFVCPSLLSRNSHKLEFDAPHDAVESLEPTTTVSS